MKLKRIAFLLGLSVCLSGCSTVKMPKIDLVKSPEFSEDAANIAKDYPRLKDAPEAPTDIRSASAWDKDARAMQALRNESSGIAVEPAPTKSETTAQFEALKAKVHDYKKDDPVSGPIEGFPDYDKRR